MLQQDYATKETVTYIQARLKTVWVRSNEGSTIDAHEVVNSGAYGVIVNDFNAMYDVLESYPSGSYVRTAFNIAHRGLSGSYNDNSYMGAAAAMGVGATHLELDGFLTADNQIILNHDATVSYYSEGYGTGTAVKTYIDDLTYAQIQSGCLLTTRGPDEPLPLLDDVMKLMKRTDVVLVFEFKAGNMDATQKVTVVQTLKTMLDKYDFYDQIVVISFDTVILGHMKTYLPQVPTARLGNAGMTSFLNDWGSINATIDADMRYMDKSASESFFRDRGYLSYSWTQDTTALVESRFNEGFIGLTNNYADYLEEKVKSVDAVATETETVAVGDTITVLTTTYGDITSEVSAGVYAVEEERTCFNVVATYTVDGRTYYDYVVVPKPASAILPEETPPPEEDEDSSVDDSSSDADDSSVGEDDNSSDADDSSVDADDNSSDTDADTSNGDVDDEDNEDEDSEDEDNDGEEESSSTTGGGCASSSATGGILLVCLLSVACVVSARRKKE